MQINVEDNTCNRQKNIQSNLSYLSVQGNVEIWSHITGGH